jgi:hypothetical protein
MCWQVHSGNLAKLPDERAKLALFLFDLIVDLLDRL